MLFDRSIIFILGAEGEFSSNSNDKCGEQLTIELVNSHDVVG